MEPTRRPEDEVQLNKTPAEQEEPEYSLEEIMNEFGGWTKREEQAAEPGETVRLASPAGRAPDAPASEEDEEPADTIRFAPVHTKTESEPERPAVWTYQGEPDPEPAAADPREARERARAERRERRQAEKRRRQLERFQKKEARKKRAAEQPEHVFSSLEAAYQFYSAASSVRLRLLLSVLTCLASILLLVLSASSVIGDFSGYSRVFSAIMLGLLLAQALLSYDICLSGVMQALRLRFDQTSMLFVVLCVVIVDAFFAVMQGRTPFCTVASVLLLLALWGRSLLYEARRRSLRAAGNMEEPVAAVREEKAWHGYDCIFRAPGDAAQFAIQLEMPDAGSRIMRVYAPVMTAVTLVLSILTAMRGGKSFLWSWTAMLLAGFPAGVLIAYAKPFSTFAKKLYRVGAAVAGWQGARILSGEAGLIIEDADRMGLAQLYQIRGRVGRSGRKAYAYFTFRRDKTLTDIAQKRLSAIREFTAFGSGFRIAMRDLQIRGAGSLLGHSQHGHMEAVGYDLYVKMLGQAIARAKGEPVQRDKSECLVDLRVDAYIPEKYIADGPGRIEAYKRIAAIQTAEDAADVLDELIDRYGDPPPSVSDLVNVSLVRVQASAVGVTEVTQKKDTLTLQLESLDLPMIRGLLVAFNGRVTAGAGSKPYLSVTLHPDEKPLELLQSILKAMAEILKPAE